VKPSDAEVLDIEAILRDYLGPKIHFRPHDRGPATPMNLVLDEVERQIDRPTSVYWINNGAPRLFVLSDFESIPVGYSPRYVEASSALRNVLAQGMYDHVREQATAGALLELIADLLLIHNSPEEALEAQLASWSATGIRVPLWGRLMDLEYAEKNEAYMVVWFFGLVHEFGHAQDSARYEAHAWYSDASLAAIVAQVTAGFELGPTLGGLVDELRATEGSVLSTRKLREEALADAFAVSVLYAATVQLMHRLGRKFDPIAYIYEVILQLQVISVMRTCQGWVDMIVRGMRSEALVDAKAGQIACGVRLRLLGAFLGVILSNGNEELRARFDQAIEELLTGLGPTLKQATAGLSRAQDAVTSKQGMTADLLAEFVSPDLWPMQVLLGRAFIVRVREFNPDLPDVVQTFERIVGSSSGGAAEILDSEVRKLFLVPWVKGPTGDGTPFSLHTRHGRLLFVFLAQDDLFDSYMENSRTILKPGYELVTGAVTAIGARDLGRVLARRLGPVGVVVQGTATFDELMEELYDDTIWPEEAD